MTDKDIDQLLSALEEIREHAATKGGTWAAGVATLCLAALAIRSPLHPAGSAEVPRAEE